MSNRDAVFASLCLVVLVGCGGSEAVFDPPQPSPTPPPPVTTVVAQGEISGLPAAYVAEVSFSTTSPGSIQAVVDWTFTESDVDVGIVRGTCTVDQMNGGTCPWLGLSTSATAKPERLSLASVGPGQYTMYVVNWGPDTESLSYQVLHTTGGSASSASAKPVARLKRGIGGIR